MKFTDKQSGSPKTMLGTAKPSHIISKLKAASTGMIPTYRTVQIPPPQIFKTDPANFLALVQKLTGNKPAPKRVTGTVGSKKKKSIVPDDQSAANHSHALKVVDENCFPKQASEKEYPIERDSMEEGGVQISDSFSELYGGLERDLLNILINSWSARLPEFPMSYPPVEEQIDYHTTIFETLNTGVKDLRKQNILFAKSFLRRLHKSRVSFAQHSLTNFTCLLLKVQTVDEHSFPKQVREKEYPLIAIKRDSLEEDGVQVCDSFSQLFGGLQNLDFLSTLKDSW
ncbi:hypothetical protein SUGI_0422290 [Cryptomeria japonica]|nr:hypothetical protein SUGI_0422290 [Cryptomeria japonica]